MDAALVDRLATRERDAVALEDYCHAVEHAIEFQVLFLQHRFGPRCASYRSSAVRSRRLPRVPAAPRTTLASPASWPPSPASRPTSGRSWVLGVDMAHVGRRYGDADRRRGRSRVGCARSRSATDSGSRPCVEGDADGFWAQVQEGADDLRWCGASALYTFLRAASPARGALLRYEQWNIDPESVVTFGALAYGASASAGE